MDWTGGTRKIYVSKSTRNTLLQTQKAHFAKKRAEAQHTASSMPDFMREAYDNAASYQLRMALQQSRTGDGLSRGSQPASNKHKHTLDSRTIHNRSNSRQSESRKNLGSTQRVRGSQADAIKRMKSTAASPSDLSEEDRVLLATRQRLLARSDWLGLAAARPRRHVLPAQRNDDRVGKRRRVLETQPQEHHLQQRERVAAPFLDHVPQFEPMMSGALQNDRIQIKVGTDAFVSQTQASRQSHVSVNTSMRPPSTEFGPISEESMLFGVDKDGFETVFGQSFHIDNSVTEGLVESGTHVEQQKSPFEAHTQTQSIEVMNVTESRYETYAYSGEDLDHGQAKLERPRDYVQAVYVGNYVNEQPLAAATSCNSDPPEINEISNPNSRARPIENSNESEDDQYWRDLMKLGRGPIAHTSMIALDSSSIHATQSTASQWLPISHLDQTQHSNRAHGDEVADVMRHFEDVNRQPSEAALYEQRNHVPCQMSALLVSPNTPQKTFPHHKQEHVKQASLKHSDTKGDEELWRGFIVGMDDSDSESFRFGACGRLGSEKEMLSPCPPSHLQSAEDDRVQSDKATIGASTVFAAPNSTDGDGDPNGLAGGNASPAHTNTSLVGNAATTIDGRLTNLDYDGQIPPRQPNRDENHVSGIAFNRTRFKGWSARPERLPVWHAERFAPPGTSVCATAHITSENESTIERAAGVPHVEFKLSNTCR